MADREAKPEHERTLNLAGKAWLTAGIGPQRGAPSFCELLKPLSKSCLAVISSGGFVAPGQIPFSTGKLGDPTFRPIPRSIDPARLEIHHTHYDHRPARRDINVLFPLPLVGELVEEGVIGESADVHYSFMGYIPLTRKIESRYAPQVSGLLKQQEVDAALLVAA